MTTPDAPSTSPTPIRWERDWDAALARARAERRPLLVDVEKDH